VSQFVNIARGNLDSFHPGDAAICFLFSWIVALSVGMFIPCEAWGFAFAEKCSAKRGTLSFDLLVNLVVNTVFSTVMTFVMTWFALCVLGSAPLAAILPGFFSVYLPIWLSCYLTSLLFQRPARCLAQKISNAKMS